MPKLKKFRPTCIRQWRHYRGMTLETVAERINMTPGLVSLVERGLRGYTQDTVEALASALRTDPAGLLTRDPTDPKAISTAYRKAHERLVDNPPWLYIVHDLNPRAMSSKVKGFVSPQSWFVDLTLVSVQ